MNPATSFDTKVAIERFALLPKAQQREIMDRRKLIQTVDDLDGLPGKVADQLRPLIEQQATTSS